MSKEKNKEYYRKLLIELNFNISSKGFEYFLEMIEIYKKSKDKWSCTMEEMYTKIAKKYDNTRAGVERAIRTAYAPAKKNIAKKYKYNGKLSNKSILRLIILD